MAAEFRVVPFFYLFRNSESANITSGITNLVFWEMVTFSNTINHLATQMNNKTSFKQNNKERYIIVAGVKE